MGSGRATPRPAAIQAAIERRLGIDARALAAFRVAIGAIIVADLLYRSRSLAAFYTDRGVVPRTANAEVFPTLSSLSLHGLSGGAWLQWLLFAVAGGLGVLLVIGYRTRIVATASWLLLASLQFRNYLVLNGGDTVLLVALFVALFLPLGERWSVDAVVDRRAAGARHRVVGFASAALLTQVVLIYATNAVFKLRSDAWLRGDAVLYVFQVDRLTVYLGDPVAEVPALLVAINWAWVAMLVASPLLLVAVGRARTGVVAAYAAAHSAMYLTMDLGFFPHAMIACLLLFLPATAWERVDAAVAPTAGALGERLETTARSLPPGPRPPPRVREAAIRVAPAVTATILLAGLLWQGVAVGLVSAPSASPVDPADHSWKLFAPHPPTSDGWFVVAGTLASGGIVDLYPHADTLDSRPRDSAGTYPSTRWRKYLAEVRQDAVVRRYFAAYLCRRGADRYGDPVDSLTIEYVRESSGLDGPERTTRVDLGTYRCPVVD